MEFSLLEKRFPDTQSRHKIPLCSRALLDGHAMKHLLTFFGLSVVAVSCGGQAVDSGNQASTRSDEPSQEGDAENKVDDETDGSKEPPLPVLPPATKPPVEKPPVEKPPKPPTIDGGYAEAGDWRGYLFTDASDDSQISPNEFTGSQTCAAGKLGTSEDAWASIGWLIAQDIDPETFQGLEAHAIAPGGSGMAYQVLNLDSSPLRVELRSFDSPEKIWCAPIAAESGTILWSEFSRDCWEAGGEAYDGMTPISEIMFTATNAGTMKETTFNFCLVRLGPVE